MLIHNNCLTIRPEYSNTGRVCLWHVTLFAYQSRIIIKRGTTKVTFENKIWNNYRENRKTKPSKPTLSRKVWKELPVPPLSNSANNNPNYRKLQGPNFIKLVSRYIYIIVGSLPSMRGKLIEDVWMLLTHDQIVPPQGCPRTVNPLQLSVLINGTQKEQWTEVKGTGHLW